MIFAKHDTVLKKHPCPTVSDPMASIHVPTKDAKFLITDLSFATDLLFSMEQVQSYCQDGITTQQSVISLLKSRINLENTYALELSKIAQQTYVEDTECGASMKNALGTLRAQYLNSSTQHRVFAKSLEEDVLEPIVQLASLHGQKAHNLCKLLSIVKKQAKHQEEQYKKDFTLYEKHFRDASLAFSAAMDVGFSSTLIEQEYHTRLHANSLRPEADDDLKDKAGCRTDSPAMIVPEQSCNSDPTQKKMCEIAVDRPSLKGFPTANNSHKLVHWFLSSEQHRRQGIYMHALKTLQTAERTRQHCQRSWTGLEIGKMDMLRSIQSVLTEYQQIAEHRISNLATNLRKHIVFESSMLANQQYDWQMVATKVENIDFESDIREFILNNLGKDLSTTKVCDACNTIISKSGALIQKDPKSKHVLPVRKDHLRVSDVAGKKIPIDLYGNQAPLADHVLVRTAQNKHTVNECASSGRDETLSHKVSGQVGSSACDSETLPDEHEHTPRRVCLAREIAKILSLVYDCHAESRSCVYPASSLLSEADVTRLVESHPASQFILSEDPVGCSDTTKHTSEQTNNIEDVERICKDVQIIDPQC